MCFNNFSDQGRWRNHLKPQNAQNVFCIHYLDDTRSISYSQPGHSIHALFQNNRVYLSFEG